MTQDTDGGDRRTEARRFDGDDAPFGADDLIEGDRIDPALVAATLDGLGATFSARRDAAPTQLARVTITNGLDDVHSAILVDGESGVLVTASRHDRQSAWTQKEADWKVRSRGDRVSVESAEVAQDGNGELDGADVASEAEAWANVVLQDRARGETGYNDELTYDGGGTLVLRICDGPMRVVAEIELVETNGGSA